MIASEDYAIIHCISHRTITIAYSTGLSSGTVPHVIYKYS